MKTIKNKEITIHIGRRDFHKNYLVRGVGKRAIIVVDAIGSFQASLTMIVFLAALYADRQGWKRVFISQNPDEASEVEIYNSSGWRSMVFNGNLPVGSKDPYLCGLNPEYAFAIHGYNENWCDDVNGNPVLRLNKKLIRGVGQAISDKLAREYAKGIFNGNHLLNETIFPTIEIKGVI